MPRGRPGIAARAGRSAGTPGTASRWLRAAPAGASRPGTGAAGLCPRRSSWIGAGCRRPASRPCPWRPTPRCRSRTRRSPRSWSATVFGRETELPIDRLVASLGGDPVARDRRRWPVVRWRPARRSRRSPGSRGWPGDGGQSSPSRSARIRTWYSIGSISPRARRAFSSATAGSSRAGADRRIAQTIDADDQPGRDQRDDQADRDHPADEGERIEGQRVHGGSA